MATVTSADLYAFGNRHGARPPRVNQDIFPNTKGELEAETKSPWHGASAFADATSVPLTGHYHKLPAGTALPDGLGVVADGQDVDAESSNFATHHTIYPTRAMPVDEFIKLFLDLPWEYEGKK